jgi:hypothetical protein
MLASIIRMKWPAGMPGKHPFEDDPSLEDAVHYGCICDGIFIGLIFSSLLGAGPALAGDQTSISGSADTPEIRESRQPQAPVESVLTLPTSYLVPSVSDDKIFSATEFRPRGHSIFDGSPYTNAAEDAPMLRGTSVWQRMSDYKSQNGVRLLTLWEFRASTVSIQAGKKGDPSLQWTSRFMNRGAATRGLFDQLFSVSLARAGNTMRGAARPTAVDQAPKPVPKAAAKD